MKNDAISALAKARRNCQVDLVGEDVAQAVKLQSRVVGNDAFSAAPKADQRQILVVSGGPLGETVDGSLDSSPVSAGGVVMLEPCRVADRSSLPGREVARLASGDSCQTPSPVLLKVRSLHFIGSYNL